MTTKRETTIPTDDDFRAMTKACKANATGHRNRVLLEVLRYSGLRISEALALEVRDVQTIGNGVQLHVRHGKGGKARHAVLLNGAVAELRGWLEARSSLNLPENAPVFCVLNGKRAGAPLTRAYVDSMLKRLAYDAGLPSWQRVHAHAFRHAHATALYRADKPLAAIQQQLGHAHAVTTQTYLAKLGATDLVALLNDDLAG